MNDKTPFNPTRAWIFLIALSMGSTLIALSGQSGLLASLAILLLAWGKARVILRQYLGLAQAPGWSRGFSLVLAIYMIVAMGLTAAAGG